jgi:glucan phosphoethanolaminetransferase (alkaline phosphatase superfamily)
MYSHAPVTIGSLPVLFNSQYFAAVRAWSSGRAELWRLAESAGFQTSFFSSTDLAWDNFSKLASLHSVRTLVDVKQFGTEVPIRAFSKRHHDIAAPDSYLLEKFERFTTNDNAAQLQVVYLLNTHAPYVEEVPSCTLLVDDSTTTSSGYPIPRPYLHSVCGLDTMVSRVVDTLATRGTLDRSVIFVTTDHGEAFGEHGAWQHGANLFDEQTKIPFLVRVGSKLPHLRRCLEDAATSVRGLVDVVPTISELMGGEESPEWQGSSILSFPEKGREVLYYGRRHRLVGVVTKQRKYLYYVQGGRAAYYDLRGDPAETRAAETARLRSLSEFISFVRTSERSAQK